MRKTWTTLIPIVVLRAFVPVIAANAQNVTTTGGTANSVPKFSGSTTIVNSAITESSGNVGIGTTSPGALLDVNGTGLVGGTTRVNSTNNLEVQNNSAGTGTVGINLVNDANTTGT